MARSAVLVALLGMVLFASTIEAQNIPVRQLFIWKLQGGIGQAAGNRAIRIALYNAWNKVNPGTVTNYWVGQQNDGLLFAKKDDTWGDIGGFTDWATVPAYKSFKVWERAQPRYQSMPVADRNRLVAYV